VGRAETPARERRRPNDDETPYHAPETRNNALEILVERGRLNSDSLATMRFRKADWHDPAGIRFLLERGADPNRMTRWHHTALHQALRRNNGLTNIELLLDHGADPKLANRLDGRSAVALAAGRGTPRT
jgi:ankyrin repeat protein